MPEKAASRAIARKEALQEPPRLVPLQRARFALAAIAVALQDGGERIHAPAEPAWIRFCRISELDDELPGFASSPPRPKAGAQRSGGARILFAGENLKALARAGRIARNSAKPRSVARIARSRPYTAAALRASHREAGPASTATWCESSRA